jgi:hypothetical protein
MNDTDVILTRTDRRRLERVAQLARELARDLHRAYRMDDQSKAKTITLLIAAVLMDADAQETAAAFGGRPDDDGPEAERQETPTDAPAPPA